MEGDLIPFTNSTSFCISILALVWRATCLLVKYVVSRTFQSSPSCGGRRYSYNQPATGAHISILALVWRATFGTVQRWQFLDISILALVWRATNVPLNRKSTIPFQSSPSCGGRLTLTINPQQGHTFQSSPSCGGRRLCFVFFLQLLLNFNPRPRVEGDSNDWQNYELRKRISILALVWRAT